MGNQNSRATTPTHPQSPTSVTASHGAAPAPGQAQAAQERAHLPHIHHSARRRESIQALSTVKAQAAPPSASLENAESHPTLIRPHSRGRSQTVAASTTAAVANQLRAAHDNLKPPAVDAMGNEQSSQKGHHKEKEKGAAQHLHHHHQQQQQQRENLVSREVTPPHLRSAAASSSSSPPDKEKEKDKNKTQQERTSPQQQSLPVPQQQQQPQPKQAFAPSHSHSPSPSPSPLPAPSPQTQPVNVPTFARDEPAVFDPEDASQDYIVPSSHFSRPPRLPLPIEEELHTPGSPILSPQDLSSPLDHGEVEGTLPRRTSMLSTTTADDDDLGEEFKGPSSGRPTVPTLIEWEGPGERVYVTGTFAGWNRKYRLHRNGPSKKKDALSAYVSITPGTHHLMFIVDNDMRTSDKLPTAVDYTNILVNYLEVSYDDIPQPPADTTDRKESIDAATPVQEREPPPGVYPPQVLPPTPEIQPVKAPVPEPPKPKAPEPTKKYHQSIPKYLLDLDAPEESSRFARANAMTNNLPTPPSLPGFLGKSILNGTTPMKDDSSVLIHPNHTVLNHLATSSIKDNILATSATTRYKQKFLTTIMYKPKEEDPDRLY